MQTENKGVATPQKENIEKVKTLDEEIENMTGKNAMDMELEDLDSVGCGSSILDRQNLKVPDIIEVHEKRKKLGELVYILPRQTIYWIIQRYDIYDRLSQTKFFDWYNSKKELSYKDYRNLEIELNKDKDGISLSELSILTGKDEDYLFKELRAGCGLSIVNCTSYGFVMENYLYVKLIPVVNEKSQLTDEIKAQYLLKGNALQLLAEYWSDDYIADTYC